MTTHTRAEAGMTLVELLIAMTVMSIGITAIVAGFSSGLVTVVRATKASSAGALADQQMETLRGLSFASIGTTDTTAISDGVYKNTSAPYSSPYDSAWKIDTVSSASCASQAYCTPTRTITAGGGSYRIDTYVAWKCVVSGSTLGGTVSAPSCSTPTSGPSIGVASRPVKLVTVVVRNASSPSKTLFRESSTFDQATG